MTINELLNQFFNFIGHDLMIMPFALFIVWFMFDIILARFRDWNFRGFRRNR
jgi:TRAP-type mannitol/chloroaromatic compound transport system permease small subunit